MRFIFSSLESSKSTSYRVQSLVLRAAALRMNASKSVFVEGMGHFEAKYEVKGLRLPPTSIHHYIVEWFKYNFADKSLSIARWKARGRLPIRDY